MIETVNTSESADAGAASASADPRQGPGFIDAKHEAHRKFTLIGKNDEEIQQTAGELLEGSKLLINRGLVTANLTAVLKKVMGWCEENADSLKAAMVTFHSGKMTLFFVSTTVRYSVALDEKMTSLEVDLGGSAGIGSVESFQIPDRSVDQFVGTNALMIWERSVA